MKVAISAIAVAIVSGLVFSAIGHSLEIYHYVVILFGTSLLVWTFEQYDEHNQHH